MIILYLTQTILLTASTNKLSVTHDEAENYASLIMESLDKKNKGYIEVPIRPQPPITNWPYCIFYYLNTKTRHHL